MKAKDSPNDKGYRVKRKGVLIVCVICLIITTCLLIINSISKIKQGSIAKANNIPHVNLVKTAKNNDKKDKQDASIDKRENKIPIGTDMDSNISRLSIKGQKVAYLTFDDGPSSNVTPKILNILDNYDIKATFFVIGQMAEANKDVLIREKAEGETIGNHTFTHNYKYIYGSPKNLIDDFNKCSETIKDILGKDYDIKYARFPGGSFGKKLETYRDATEKAGYSFIDWNCIDGDGEGNNISPKILLEKIKQTSIRKKTLVVLLHDASTKSTTVQALPNIIEYLKSQGYIFKTLN